MEFYAAWAEDTVRTTMKMLSLILMTLVGVNVQLKEKKFKLNARER